MWEHVVLCSRLPLMPPAAFGLAEFGCARWWVTSIFPFWPVQKWWVCAVFRGSSQWYITEPCLNAQHIASYFWCVFRMFDRASICCLMCSWQRDQLRMECKTYSRWVYVLSLSCYHANDQSLMPIEATELLFVWISHICSVVQAHENPL